MTIAYEFKTQHFRVTARILPDYFADLSFMEDDPESMRKIAEGIWTVFSVEVLVTYYGIEVGSDHLGACIYEDPRDFFSGHRDPDPKNRNCSEGMKIRGGTYVCHYFPDMISAAVREARRTVRHLQAINIRQA